MTKAENVARVHTHTPTHTHTGNLLENNKAKKLALLNIDKTGYKHESV